jgi:topoisomerase-4 subunit A
LTADKLKQVNLLESLPFEEPEEEVEEIISTSEEGDLEDIPTDTDDDGQITLSLE